MEKNKEEIITDLYALRAGLSVVSQKADEVRGCEKETANAKKLYNEAVETKEEIEKQCAREQERYSHCQKELNAVNYNEFFKKEKERVGNALFLQLIFGLMLPVSILLGIYLPIFVFKINVIVSLIIFALLFAGSSIGLHFLRLKKMHKRARKEYNKEIMICEWSVNNAKQEVERANSILASSNEKIKKSYAKVIEINKDNDKTIKERVEESNFLDIALTKQYSELLSPSDWQNIDLIISYLSTGRADTMKEALQLADRQRQTDAIVNEIKKANISICSEIRGGFRALGTAMGQCFELLSRQLAKQHSEILASHSVLAEKLGDIKGQTEQLISAQQLSNALSVKANVSSDLLRNDLLYMQKKMGMYN